MGDDLASRFFFKLNRETAVIVEVVCQQRVSDIGQACLLLVQLLDEALEVLRKRGANQQVAPVALD